jgi:hypothetical protein
MPRKKKEEGDSIKIVASAKRGTLNSSKAFNFFTSEIETELKTFQKKLRKNDAMEFFYKNPNLNLLEAAFLSKYVKHFNGSRALREMGYTAERAKLNMISHHFRTKHDVKQALREYFEKNERKDRESERQFVTELKKIAFGTLDDIAEWDENGNLKLVPSSELDDGARALPESVKQTIQYDKYGEETKRTVELKKENKLQAMKLLGAYYGWIGTNPVDVEKGRGGLGVGARAQVTRELAEDIAAFERTGKISGNPRSEDES